MEVAAVGEKSSNLRRALADLEKSLNFFSINLHVFLGDFSLETSRKFKIVYLL